MQITEINGLPFNNQTLKKIVVDISNKKLKKEDVDCRFRFDYSNSDLIDECDLPSSTLHPLTGARVSIQYSKGSPLSTLDKYRYRHVDYCGGYTIASFLETLNFDLGGKIKLYHYIKKHPFSVLTQKDNLYSICDNLVLKESWPLPSGKPLDEVFSDFKKKLTSDELPPGILLDLDSKVDIFQRDLSNANLFKFRISGNMMTGLSSKDEMYYFSKEVFVRQNISKNSFGSRLKTQLLGNSK